MASFPAAQRDGDFARLLDDVRGALEALSGQMQTGEITPSRWRDRAGSILRNAYSQAYTLGGQHYDDSFELVADDREVISNYLRDDLDFLQGFYQDVKESAGPGYRGLTDAYVDNRIGMYADALNAMWWQGANAAQETGTFVSWVAEPDACIYCAAMVGQYPVDQLPAVPGADVCAGLDRCRCHLEYTTRGL